MRDSHCAFVFTEQYITKKILFAFLSIALLCGSSVFAQTGPPDNASGPLSGWALLPNGFTVGDKTFTYIFDDIPLDAFVEISKNSDTNYSLSLAGLGSIAGPTSFSLCYSVQITDPSKFFATSAIDSTHNTDLVTATKSIFGDFDEEGPFNQIGGNSTSLNGAAGGDINLGGLYQLIYVQDTITLDETGRISGFSNTFVQTPEPSSLALLGLGAAGLFHLARRRRKA